jgi:hypothetical protein
MELSMRIVGWLGIALEILAAGLMLKVALQDPAYNHPHAHRIRYALGPLCLLIAGALISTVAGRLRKRLRQG